MKTSFTIFSLLAVGHAFPDMSGRALEAMMARVQAEGKGDVFNKIQARNPSQTEAQCGPRGPCTTFDAAEQLVDITGEHAYQEPGPLDIRGPCPGLNAAANHGYLPRDGVANILGSIEGLGQVYGMSTDLAGFLAAYAVVMDGDALTQTWSIGGTQPEVITLDGVVGQPEGVGNSHNKYEGDTSICRGDAYIHNGDAYTLQIPKFKLMYEAAMDDDRLTMDKLRLHAQTVQQYSVANNPRYFAPLFSTTLVAQAAHLFVATLMGNHSAEEPDGYTSNEIFKSFFGVSGDYPNFSWSRGQERIPENYYRRPSSNQYTAADVIADALISWDSYPDTFRFGGNVNGVNTYTGVDLANLTGGLYNSQSIFEGNNFACLLFQSQQQALPDILKNSNLFGTLNAALGVVDQYVTPLQNALECPQLTKYDTTLFNQYPGASYEPPIVANM